MEEAYKLSKVNRTKSDEKTFEANEVLTEMTKLGYINYRKGMNH